jgi:sulfite reductase beta subunit-like hemoprotein
MNVRDELPELIARGYEDIPEEDIVRLYWYALAHDKPKTGTFMVRVKVAGGLLSGGQVRALARITRQLRGVRTRVAVRRSTGNTQAIVLTERSATA